MRGENPSPSDSLLFFALARKTDAALRLYRDIHEGRFPGEAGHLEEILGVVDDTPTVESILKLAIEEVDLNLKLAGALAEKHGLTELRDRIRAIDREVK